ncbi:MAG: sigma-54 interaction domain-containing protein, partial [Planctomycetota bacterium]
MTRSVVLLLREPDLRGRLAARIRESGREVISRYQAEGWAALVGEGSVGTLIVAEDLIDADPDHILRKAEQLRSDLTVARLGGGEEKPLRVEMASGKSTIEDDPERLAEWLLERIDEAEGGSLPGEKEGSRVVFGDGGPAELLVAGRNEKIREILRIVDTVAPTDSTVLIQGESGTGKDLFARLLHQKSRRRSGPWVAVNCGAIPPNLMESELFGHEKGAFTGAHAAKEGLCVSADGGTLFLDEIGEIPLNMQVKLLRVLQSGQLRPLGATGDVQVNFRVIAATNRNLKEEVKAGRFRLDLFYRLNVIGIQLPALRDRPEDIRDLVDVTIRRLTAKGIQPTSFEPQTIDLLSRHSWPGNVRELENVVERLLLLYPDGRVPEREARMQI